MISVVSLENYIQNLLENLNCDFLHCYVFFNIKHLFFFRGFFWVVVFFTHIFLNHNLDVFWNYHSFVLVLFLKMVVLLHWFRQVTQVAHVYECQHFALFLLALKLPSFVAFPLFCLFGGAFVITRFALTVFAAILQFERLVTSSSMVLLIVLMFSLYVYYISLAI